ncbi:hypothetical protein Agabi119p4_2732 [Agaricus bisporus var. burnettii]|nr:hypothetical protein Agabi119p4_2732 [Agaricus bisporus var. burnettii]
MGLSPQPPVIDLRKVMPRAGSRIISSGPSGGTKLPDVPHTSNPIPPPLSGIISPNQGTPPLAPPPSVGRPLLSSTPLIRLPEQYRVPVVSNSSSLRAAPDKSRTSRDRPLGQVPPQTTFQVSPDLYRPRRTPIRLSEKRKEGHSPAKSAPPLGKKVTAHTPSTRHHPYASGRDYKHRPLSADTAVGFNVSRNLFKPQRTPITRRGELNGPSPLPFVVPSRVDGVSPVNHMLQSPFELPTPETRFNPARRLDFTGQRAAKKKVRPNTGSTDDVFGPQTSDSRRAPYNSVATTSTIGALSTLSHPSFYVSPNTHSPPETPISNSPGVRSASLQIPVLDRGLQDVLETILTRLQDKCPMCYYQGYNYDHTLYGCPKNAVSKLAGSKDTQWERW